MGVEVEIRELYLKMQIMISLRKNKFSNKGVFKFYISMFRNSYFCYSFFVFCHCIVVLLNVFIVMM